MNLKMKDIFYSLMNNIRRALTDRQESKSDKQDWRSTHF